LRNKKANGLLYIKNKILRYLFAATGLEKKTKGIANGPTSSAASTHNVLLALRYLAT
jgi:hypothetical protein